MEITKEKIQELEMKLWFSENELYGDGSNIYDWIPRLKKEIEQIFDINLTKENKK